MAKKKYPTITQNEDGFSDWIKPLMKGYKMACCDCGLVHKTEFQVIKKKKIIKEYKDGNHEWEYADVKSDKYEVVWRVGRDNRATGQFRRYNKLKK